MSWFQEGVMLFVIAMIGLGVIHELEKIARILNHHLDENKEHHNDN